MQKKKKKHYVSPPLIVHAGTGRPRVPRPAPPRGALSCHVPERVTIRSGSSVRPRRAKKLTQVNPVRRRVAVPRTPAHSIARQAQEGGV